MTIKIQDLITEGKVRLAALHIALSRVPFPSASTLMPPLPSPARKLGNIERIFSEYGADANIDGPSPSLEILRRVRASG